MGATALPITAMLACAMISFARVASGGTSSTLITRATSQSPSQVILVHPSDNLSAVLEYASPGDVLLLANGQYQPGVTVVIDKNITIAAQNVGQAVLDGQNDHCVIEIDSGTVTLKGLNITGGYIVAGGGVAVNDGIVSFVTCNIYSNHAVGGGGVYINDGTVNFDACNIFENTANTEGRIGGGVCIGSGDVTFTSVDIHSNRADNGGGVAVLGGTVSFLTCNIFENTATNGSSSGAGVFISGGDVTFTDINIHNNEATLGSGGGVFVYDFYKLTMKGTNITSNTAYEHGGGIYVGKGVSQPPKLDDKTSVKSNKPDDCYGFWSSPACFGSAERFLAPN